MKSVFYFLLPVLLCCACSRGKYYITDVFRKGEEAGIQMMELDSTYHFYLREVYKDKNQRMENVLKTNVEIKETASKTRIEVEYLLLSWEHKTAVYISTIPDKYHHYYSLNHYADTLINAYDFSTFHFGTIAEDGESICFASKNNKRVITWDIRPFITRAFPNKVSIREIAIQQNSIMENVVLINSALEEPVSFTRQKNFTIIFGMPDKNPANRTDALSPDIFSDKKIYYTRHVNGVDLFFRFDKNVSNSKDSAIRFDYRRTRYIPLQKQL